MQIVRIRRLLRAVQIAVGSDELADALFHLRPFQGDGLVAIFQGNTFAVVILPNAGAGDSVGVATDAIFVFQELDVILGAFALLELLVDAELALGNAAAACQYIVDCRLRERKGIVLFSLCRFNQGHLLSL